MNHKHNERAKLEVNPTVINNKADLVPFSGSVSPCVTLKGLERRLAVLAQKAGLNYEELSDGQTKPYGDEAKVDELVSDVIPVNSLPKDKSHKDICSTQFCGTQEKWSCSKCTFHNNATNHECEMCLWSPFQERRVPSPPSFRDIPNVDDVSWPKAIPSPPPFPKPIPSETLVGCKPDSPQNSSSSESVYRLNMQEFPVLVKENLKKLPDSRRKSLRELTYLHWQQDDMALNAKFRRHIKGDDQFESPPAVEDDKFWMQRKPRRLTVQDFMDPLENPPVDMDEKVKRAIRDERRYHRWRRETAIMPLRDNEDQPHSA